MTGALARMRNRVCQQSQHCRSFCFPTFALEDVFAKLNVQHFSALAAANREGDRSATIQNHLGETILPANAILGEAHLTLRELLNLEPGDVLRTSIPVGSEVAVMLGGKPRFWGTPGISRGKVSVKITRTNVEPLSGE